jgi:phenylpyruvate tautomerase PptA (4-oxalocrotonate tautomerase family)
MPFYECFVQEGTLTADRKADIAKEITRIHCAVTGAPESFVTVIFHSVQHEDIFTAGEPSSAARIRGSIRAGRSPEVKTRLLTELAEMWQRVTGLSDKDLTVSLVEVPAKNSVKGGRFVPEPGQEAEWLAASSQAR